jgi:hypothetical protein
MLLTASSRSFEWLLHVGTHIYEQKQKRRIKKRINKICKMQKCKNLEESDDTGFINSEAPSFPESAKVGKKIITNITRQIILDSR